MGGTGGTRVVQTDNCPPGSLCNERRVAQSGNRRGKRDRTAASINNDFDPGIRRVSQRGSGKDGIDRFYDHSNREIWYDEGGTQFRPDISPPRKTRGSGPRKSGGDLLKSTSPNYQNIGRGYQNAFSAAMNRLNRIGKF